MTPLVTLISVEYNALLMNLFILNVFFFFLVCMFVISQGDIFRRLGSSKDP